VNGSPFPSGAIQELVTFPSEWEVWKKLFQNVVNSQAWNNVHQVFKLKVCGRELFHLLKVSMLKFEKVCGKEFYKLLRVSTLKFEVCGREFFNLSKFSNFKCVKECSLPLLEVSNEISSLCKKFFQMFEGFLVKVLFCDI
jgi:hypothetical protein